MDGLSACTINIWCKPIGASQSSLVGGNNSVAETNESGISLNGTAGALTFGGEIQTSVDGNVAIASVVLSDTDWVCLTWLYNGSKAQLYRNGVMTTESSATGTIDADNAFWIGRFGNAGEFFGGYIDEVRLYDRALSAEELLQLYKNPSGVKTTLIDGNQITTGQIDSTNLSATRGTRIDLDSEIIQIGGTGVGFESGEGIYLSGGTDGVPQFYVGTGTTSYLSYDGAGVIDLKTATFRLDTANLDIDSSVPSITLGEGAILIDGASSKIEVGSANKVTIQGGATDNYIGFGTKSGTWAGVGIGVMLGMDATVPKLELYASETDYLFFGAGIDIKASTFELLASNFGISTNTLTATNGTIKISGGDNKIFVGDSITIDGANEKIYIGSTSTYNTSTTKFYVDGTGQMSLGDSLTFDGTDLSITGTVYASAGSFTGNISAGSGNIGNWNIVAGELAYGTDIVLDATNRAITINAGEITLAHNSGAPYLSIGQASKTYNTNGIYLGDDSGVFKMSLVGTTDSMTFDGDTLTLTGDIIAAGGTIANWDIGTNALSSGTVSLDSTSTNESFRVAKSSYSDDTPGIYLGNDSSTAKMYIGTGDNYLK